MRVIETGINDLLLLEPTIYQDERGYFFESYNSNKFLDKLEEEINFVQDNHSLSKKGVLRGLHLQPNKPQSKLVRCTRGKIFDVAVDLRSGSKTFKHWYGCELSEKNKKQLLIPKGFAHGFLTLSDIAEVQYKVSTFYSPTDEETIIWNDKEINISWPMQGSKILLSQKDGNGKQLKQIFEDKEKN